MPLDDKVVYCGNGNYKSSVEEQNSLIQ